MKCLLVMLIQIVPSHRSGAPGKTPAFTAISPRRAFNMAAAGAGIKTVRAESIRRADCKTGFFHTRVARARRRHTGRQFDPVAEQQCGAVNMPETEFRVNHDPDG